MAGKKRGFGKFLELIGLVEDQPRENEYYDDNPGRSTSSRPSTYVPPHSGARTEEARRRTVVPDERRYQSAPRAASYNYDEGYTVRPNASAAPRRAFDDDLDPAPRRESAPRRAAPQSARQPSRFAPSPAPAPSNVPAPRQTASVGTAMFALHSLEECCDVIQSLISNNVVLVSLDELDSRYTQRAVDTLSGAAYALGTTVRKASERTYLIAPRNVRVNDAYAVSGKY